MPKQSLNDLRLTAYQQRRLVELLQQQVYNDPTPEPPLAAELLEAEQALYRLEQQVASQAPLDTSGVLLHTQPSEGVMMGAESTSAEVQVLQRQSHVPTGLIHLFDPRDLPLVSIRVRNQSDRYLRLRIQSCVEGYSATATSTVELTFQGWAEFHHLPTFFPDRLQTVNELTRATLHIEVHDLDRKSEEHHSTFPIWLLAHDGAYNGIRDPATGRWIDLSPYLAAWVTPGVDAVLRVLHRAAGLHPQHYISGYPLEAAQVEEQIKAIYLALKGEDIRYAYAALALGGQQETRVQCVRLPRQVLETRQANCLDATLLFASLLEAAALNPAIVIIPGHTFLGWETQPNSGLWDYLETSLTGDYDFIDAQAKGRALAKQYHRLAEELQDGRYFKLLPLAELRVGKGILSLE